MPGFSNGLVYAENVDFTGNATKSAQIVSDGQLLIGSSLAPRIRANTPSNGANISWVVGHGTLQANVSGTTNHAVQVGNASGSLTSLAAMTNGQLVIGSTGANPSVATLTAGSGIVITNGAGTISIASSGMTWQTIGASGALVVNNGYVCTAGAALSFSLPATSAVGTIIELTLDGSTSWTITQGANQQIRIGSAQTTLGAGGSIASTAQGDSIRIVCSVANLKWNVISVVGNLSVV